MCKILIAPGIKNPENAWKLAKEITSRLSNQNDDGFGYAAMDAKGNIFSERWLKNKNAFKDYGLSAGDEALLKAIGLNAVKEEIEDDYSKFGDVKPNTITSLMLHARAATGEVCIKNTHPFIAKGTALIHNGVIYNHDKLDKYTSTCDSETILNEYIDFAVAEDANQIAGVVENLRGYFACGVMTKDGKGKPILDLFKSSRATLYVTYLEEIGGPVFCTSKFDLEASIKALGWTLNKIWEFDNDQFMRFDAVTGEKLEHYTISPTETYNPNWVSPYNADTKEEDKFEEAVLEAQKDINWVELIEAEEIDRLSKAN